MKGSELTIQLGLRNVTISHHEDWKHLCETISTLRLRYKKQKEQYKKRKAKRELKKREKEEQEEATGKRFKLDPYWLEGYTSKKGKK